MTQYILHARNSEAATSHQTIFNAFTFSNTDANSVRPDTRKADPRIGEYIKKSLANSRTVLNIGAGTGSYEPEDKYITAVEPSCVILLSSMGE